MTAKPLTKKASREDWHPAEVVAALQMRGISLRQLALINGYTNAGSLQSVLRRPYPTAEAIVAEALRLAPWDIWPTRYGPDNRPNRGPSGRRPMLPPNWKPSSVRVLRNTQKGAAR